MSEEENTGVAGDGEWEDPIALGQVQALLLRAGWTGAGWVNPNQTGIIVFDDNNDNAVATISALVMDRSQLYHALERSVAIIAELREMIDHLESDNEENQ